jgi:hypothetical protein
MSSRFPAQSESEKPVSSTSDSSVYIILKCIVPFKYRRTFFAAFQWLSEGLAMN